MKYLKIILSSILILSSFFVGYFFSKEKMSAEIRRIKDEKSVVNLEIKKDKINIYPSDKNIIILVNGNEVSSGSVILN